MHRFLPFCTTVFLLFLSACNREHQPAAPRVEYPVWTYEQLQASRVFVGSAHQSFAGIPLDSLGAVRHRQGDDPAWAAVGYDDASWSVLDAPEKLVFDCGEVHWFRVHYSIDSALTGIPLHMNIFAPGAVEVYINGRLLHQYGSIEHTPHGVVAHLPPTAPRRMIRFTFPKDRLKDGVLAFRYSICPLIKAEVGTAQHDDPAPAISIHPLDQVDRIKIHEDQSLLYFGLFVGCAFLIFLLTLILYGYNRRERSWLFISLSAFCTFVVAFTHLGRKGMLGVSYEALQVGSVFNSAAYPLSFFFLVLAMKCLFDRVTRRTVLPFAILVAVALFFRVGAFFFLPAEGGFDLLLTAIMFLEVARLSIKALRQRMYGRWILATGVFIFFFFGVFLDQYYGVTGQEMPWNQRTLMRFSYYLSMPATITIFLAVKSAENGRLAARRRDELDAEVRRRTAELEREKEKSERLLLNILPHQVAEELKEKGVSEAREFDVVTVLFADFIDFTTRAGQLPAKELLAELNQCFRAFDEIMARYHIEKIKTIGDAYMAAGGLDTSDCCCPADVVRAALTMQQFMREHRAEREALGLPYFEMRVGIHTGPVVAGIVGVIKFQYDIWGDTVNIASRMESAGRVGEVNISRSTYELVRHEAGLAFKERGMCAVKGKGEMAMYFVEAVEVPADLVAQGD